MKEQWLTYNNKFLELSPREQILILCSGLFVVFFLVFNTMISPSMDAIDEHESQISSLTTKKSQTVKSIAVLSEGIKKDPNEAIRTQIEQYKSQLTDVDKDLLSLTNELIGPVQMRQALVNMLKQTNGVKLTKFEQLPTQVLVSPSKEKVTEDGEEVTVKSDLYLYKHSIRITLSGRYFEIRNYIKSLEKMEWKFFWQAFDYKVTEYPTGELIIEMYSLSTKKEFIGV
ncbi:type II secretion system protein GspM [Thalassotalea agarivorans]|uniref:MSHA biogenesis protein MshJ n=1 Tax=Thalassotalea agarivorans TaxID=349064 RepID=A0A1I0G190_THASX|nr:type II secretion system protein M [Thalassotalea agarivorans]SET64322.1 MSHA biogenesis protein MshJ [Thalassotalea agarivorans]